MPKIRVLDPHLTNMIAAGEVVERPAGVIKELVENSLDARATSISIRYKEGGMSLIEVEDNGFGMDSVDLKNAFKRHSTSKIYEEDDLKGIKSFGFRGEALPSIASVSTVRMQSNNGQTSHEIIVNNGREEHFAPVARNKGTTIQVMDLFLQVPARLKYIKNIHYESAIIIDVIQKFALAHPNVSFSLFNDDKKVFQSMGNGRIEDVFYQVYGMDVAQNSLYFEEENYDFKISGMMALPEHSRSNRYAIWVYVNDRMIRYPKAQAAVVDAYRRHMAVDRFPIVVLKIETDPRLVDVNVHPSKWEIRLSQEKSLTTLIENTLSQKLYEEVSAPKVRTFQKHKPKQDSFEKELLNLQDQEKQWKVEEKKVEPIRYPHPLPSKHPQEHNQKHEEVEQPKKVERKQFDKDEPLSQCNEDISREMSPKLETLKVLSQMSGKYILAQGDEGLYIIDQHAAMERVRYEYYQDLLLDHQAPTQELLVPILIEGRQTVLPHINEIKSVMQDFQIDIDLFGEESFIVRSVPQWLADANPQLFIEEILDMFESEKTIHKEEVQRDVLATMACHSSVRFNEYLSHEEMVRLVEDLRSCRQPFHCPHGRPTLLKITHDQLIKEFHR